MRYITKLDNHYVFEKDSGSNIDERAHEGILLQKGSTELTLMQNYTPSPSTINVDQQFSEEGLVEYLSRPARKKIVECLSRALLESKLENDDRGTVPRKRGRPYSSGASLLADRLGISRKSVDRWLYDVMQSSNPNATKIMDLARKYILEDLEEVLWKDVERHVAEVKSLLTGHGDGE